jgi:putative Mn2+ efflux pump MntP
VLRTLTIAGLILPLAIDTFLLGTALGAAGIGRRERLRTSLILTAFEAGMPVVGFIVGAGIGAAVGGWAAYFAAAVLAVIGVVMLRPSDDDVGRNLRLLASAQGWAILALGLGISVDELAVGFGVGLLRMPFFLLIALIAGQAFLAAQLGMRLGSRLADSARQAAGRFAGILLILAAVLVIAEHVAGL